VPGNDHLRRGDFEFLSNLLDLDALMR
jgi:hypothetical protein